MSRYTLRFRHDPDARETRKDRRRYRVNRTRMHGMHCRCWIEAECMLRGWAWNTELPLVRAWGLE